MHGRDYCGKRYSSAEELLVHLKTHTNLAVSGDLVGPGAGAGRVRDCLTSAVTACRGVFLLGITKCCWNAVPERVMSGWRLE